MTSGEVLETLRGAGAVLDGHFVLSSGRHSNLYVEKFRALERPEIARSFGEELARRFKDRPVDVVLSPAVGAIVAGFVTATALGARFIFSERQDGAMTLRRGFEIGKGENVVVIEDVITTGESLREVLALVPPGVLAGIGCLVDRSESLELELPVDSLARVDAESWTPEECPLCDRGIPTSAPGSRHLL